MKRFLFTLCLLVFINYIEAQPGCTDPLATNYNSSATANDGSCVYPVSSVSPASSFNLSSTLSETSGLIQWNNQIWTHNDNADINLYSLDTMDGYLNQSYTLMGASNIDWEEISQDSNYVYVGDFGNNANGNRIDLKILRIEKNSILSFNPAIDTISFSYSDQTDFTPTGSNNTDFDCEAFVVAADSIYLFTKQWVNNKTSLYTLPKIPGTYTANLKDTFNVQGLITGAVLLQSERIIALSGYSNLLQPFVFLLYDFNDSDYFGGNKRKISISLPFHQVEGITTANGLKYYMTNEYFSQLSITTPQKFHIFDLNSFLGNYINNLILDSLAVTGAGATTPIALAAERYALGQQQVPPDAGSGIALYPGAQRIVSWEDAGLVQGIRGYGHLYGDTSLRSVSHPGPVVVAAALTTAQRTGATGRDVIVAVALGYQILEAFAIALNGLPPRMSLQIRGFRPTAICGPLAAVATAGKLLNLSAAELANSLAVACNSASGLRPNDGDPRAAILLQTGTAVQTGFAAINLSEAGVHGHPAALEGPGGFLEAYTGRRGKAVAPDRENWAILGTAVKLHATAHTIAPVIDMLLRLQREHGFEASEVTRISIKIPNAHMKISGGEKPMPTSTSDATANYPFGAAAALVSRDYLWPAAMEQLLADPDVAALAAKVKVAADADHTASFDSGEKMWPASVEVEVAGTRLVSTVDRPDGTDFNEETVEAVGRKFTALAAHWPTPVSVESIRHYVMTMDESGDFFAGLVAATQPKSLQTTELA